MDAGQVQGCLRLEVLVVHRELVSLKNLLYQPEKFGYLDNVIGLLAYLTLPYLLAMWRGVCSSSFCGKNQEDRGGEIIRGSWRVETHLIVNLSSCRHESHCNIQVTLGTGDVEGRVVFLVIDTHDLFEAVLEENNY